MVVEIMRNILWFISHEIGKQYNFKLYTQCNILCRYN